MNTKELQKKYNLDLSKRDEAFEASHLITAARVYAGLSQAELAKRIGTKQSGVSRAESGMVEPSISFLSKVARAINTEFIFYFAFQTALTTSSPTKYYTTFSGDFFPSQSFGKNSTSTITVSTQ